MTDEKADEKKDRLNGESSWEMSSVIRSFDYSMGKGCRKGLLGLKEFSVSERFMRERCAGIK